MASTIDAWQPALDRLRSASGVRVDLHYALSSGLSNVSLKIEFADQLAAFRINHPLPGVDRSAEIQILHQLGKYPWAPEVLFSDPNLGLVTRWHEPTTSIESNDDCLVAVPGILNQLHCERCCHTRLGLMHRIRQYITALDEDWLSTHPIQALTTALDERGIDLHDDSLLHMDLNPENLILTAEGLRLIDFEYAGSGPPLMDLASLCQSHALNSVQQHWLMSCYDAPTHWRTALPDALALTEWLEAAWQQLTPTRRPRQ